MPRVPVEAAVPISETTPAAEREAILEIAYLTIAADHQVREEEIDALARIGGRLTNGEPGSAYRDGVGEPAALSGRPLDALLSTFAQRRDRDGAEARLAAAAAVLTRPSLRTLAYRVACALALADLDADDREFEFDLALIDALQLDQATADQVSAEVQEAFVTTPDA